MAYPSGAGDGDKMLASDLSAVVCCDELSRTDSRTGHAHYGMQGLGISRRSGQAGHQLLLWSILRKLGVEALSGEKNLLSYTADDDLK